MTTMQELNTVSLFRLITLCQNLKLGVSIGNNGEVVAVYGVISTIEEAKIKNFKADW
jgi:hypothetical protein